MSRTPRVVVVTPCVAVVTPRVVAVTPCVAAVTPCVVIATSCVSSRYTTFSSICKDAQWCASTGNPAPPSAGFFLFQMVEKNEEFNNW